MTGTVLHLPPRQPVLSAACPSCKADLGASVSIGQHDCPECNVPLMISIAYQPEITARRLTPIERQRLVELEDATTHRLTPREIEWAIGDVARPRARPDVTRAERGAGPSAVLITAAFLILVLVTLICARLA